MTSAYIDLKVVPESLRPAMKHANKKYSQATNEPGKLKKVRAGFYFWFDGCKVWEFEKLDYEEKHDLNGCWIARSVDGFNHSEAYPTLKLLKSSFC